MSDSDDRIVRIEDKVDRINDHLSSIDSTLSAQHVSLKDHIRRTEILETKIAPLEKQDAVVRFILALLAAGGVAALLLKHLIGH